MDLSKIPACPACGSSNIIARKEEIICLECGEIFTELSPELEKQYRDASDVV